MIAALRFPRCARRISVQCSALLPRRIPLAQPYWCWSLCLPSAQQKEFIRSEARRRIALFIDEGSLSPQHLPSLLASVSSEGDIVLAMLFLHSQRDSHSMQAWTSALRKASVQAIEVPQIRSPGGVRSPLHAFLAYYVGLHAHVAADICIASTEVDLKCVLQEVNTRRGFRALAIVEEGVASNCRKHFTDKSCKLLTYSMAKDHQPKDSNGTNLIQPKALQDAFTSSMSVPASEKLGKKGHISLFIDGDQDGPDVLKQLLHAVAARGTLVQSTFFCSEHRASLWRKKLQNIAVSTVVVPRKVGGKSDPQDVRMAYDIGKQVQAGHDIAAASHDGDFCALLVDVQAKGLQAFAVLADNILAFTSLTFKPHVTAIIAYKKANNRNHTHRLVLDLDGWAKLKDYEPFDDQDKEFDEMLDFVRDVLMRFKYAEADGIALPGLAKLYHVHEVGSLTVLPLAQGIHEGYAMLQKCQQRQWKPNPMNLVMIFPWRRCGRSRRSREGASVSDSLAAGGPFLLQESCKLPEVVLRRLGYLTSTESHNDHINEALRLFVKNNRKGLIELQVDGEVPKFCAQDLHKVLTMQFALQRWRAARTDVGVRLHLSDLGLLREAQSANEEQVRSAATKFLRKSGFRGTVPALYAGLMQEVGHRIDSHQPDVRK